MTKECNGKSSCNLPTWLGVIFIFAISLIVFAGCASTETKLISMENKIHSMMPCGMMMDAMMGQGHAGHGGNEAPIMANSNMSLKPDQAEPEADHLHSPTPDLEQ